jgi:hypothetical protein
MIFLLFYLFLVFIHFFFIYYPKKKMEIASEVVKKIDAYNLGVLQRFSMQELTPEGYNRELKKYKSEFGKLVLKKYRKHHFKIFIEIFFKVKLFFSNW